MFTWGDHEPFTYTNWATGQPDNEDDRDHCVAMSLTDNRQWYDEECEENSAAFVCEIRTFMVTHSEPPFIHTRTLQCRFILLGYIYCILFIGHLATHFSLCVTTATPYAHIIRILYRRRYMQ